jgi:hypothetical protein
VRAIGLYIAMVGLPVLGVLGLLKIGASLTPPISVGGTWAVKMTSPAAQGSVCGDLAPYLASSHLTISQSGTELVLVFDDAARTTLAGQIHSDAISAKGLAKAVSAQAPVTSRAEIQFEAQVDKQAKPNQLGGTFSLSGCPAPAPLVADRQPTSSGGNP